MGTFRQGETCPRQLLAAQSPRARTVWAHICATPSATSARTRPWAGPTAEPGHGTTALGKGTPGAEPGEEGPGQGLVTASRGDGTRLGAAAPPSATLPMPQGWAPAQLVAKCQAMPHQTYLLTACNATSCPKQDVSGHGRPSLTPSRHSPTPSPAFFCHSSKTPKRILKLTSLRDHNTSSALEAFRVLSPATSHSSNLKNSTKDKAGQGEAEPPGPYPRALPLACLPLQRAAANWKMPCP